MKNEKSKTGNSIHKLFRKCGKSRIQIDRLLFAEKLRNEKKIKIYQDGSFLIERDDQKNRVMKKDLLNIIAQEICECAEAAGIDIGFSVREADFEEIFRMITRKADIVEQTLWSENDIPAQNKILQWSDEKNDFEIIEYLETMFDAERLNVEFDPQAQAPQFESVLLEIVPDAEDRRVIQEYLGASLFNANRTRKILLLYGEGGCGKSVLVAFLVGILGQERVFDLNIENINNNYELSSLTTQTLLTASEAVSRALCSSGAEWIKKAVGGDFFQTKQKFQNAKVDHSGLYSLIIVSNNKLRIDVEGRGDEWLDRLIPIYFDQHIPDERKDLLLVERLLKTEGSGIFNWLLAGARRVRSNHWRIRVSGVQRDRVEYLLAQGKPVEVFVRNHVKLACGEYFESGQAWSFYVEIHEKAGLPMLTETQFYRQLAQVMGEVHKATVTTSLPSQRRGYREFRLR